jgi:hypothetical protein
LGLGCGWIAASDPDKANIAFPDSEAKYWVAAAPVTPQTRLRIDGKYPDARYFSYNAYDVALRPTDAVADFELARTQVIPERVGMATHSCAKAQSLVGLTPLTWNMALRPRKIRK